MIKNIYFMFFMDYDFSLHLNKNGYEISQEKKTSFEIIKD